MCTQQQPASRTRFYRDKRNGKVMGVCAGIADYTGFDVALVRICFLAAVFMSGGSILPFYFIAGWVAPTKPRELDYSDSEDRHSGKASAPRRPGPRAISARASRTSTAGLPTSKAMSPPKTARSPAKSTRLRSTREGMADGAG